MRNALLICREHGQAPSWWDELSEGERALLMGDLRLRHRESTGA